MEWSPSDFWSKLPNQIQAANEAAGAEHPVQMRPFIFEHN